MRTNLFKDKDGVFYHPKYNRVIVKKGNSMSYHWNPTMIDYLKRNFSTMRNVDLAEWLDISERSVVRKARELGLKKDTSWMKKRREEHLVMAHAASAAKGYPGGFKKGVRSNPDGEFKPGHQLSPESQKKRSETIRRIYRQNPSKAKEKAYRMLEGKRAKKDRQNANTLQP